MHRSFISYPTEEGGYLTECQCRDCRRSFFVDGQNRKWVDV
jgi:hypothetical protein